MKTTAAAPSWLIAWAGTPTDMMYDNIAYDTLGNISICTVQWPDGGVGTYTATVVSTAFPGATDAYTVTYLPAGSPPRGPPPTRRRPPPGR